jgi:hypothetical protein
VNWVITKNNRKIYNINEYRTSRLSQVRELIAAGISSWIARTPTIKQTGSQSPHAPVNLIEWGVK